jgi:hypothetical protein
MYDNTMNSYDLVSYKTQPFRLIRPGHLAVISRIMGLSTHPVQMALGGPDNLF